MSAEATTGPPVTGSVPRWLSHAGTVGAVAVSAVSSLVAVSFGAGAESPDGTALSALHVLAMLVGLVLAGLLVLRRRYPVVLCVVASTAAILLPLDSSAALLFLPWALATASVRTGAACTVLTGGATVFALARDAVRDPALRVFSTLDQDTGAVTTHPGPTFFVVLGAAVLAASIAAGLVRRSRGAAARAQEQRDAEATASAVLRDQMTRQEERELIAREVHDTVAHHIAAISLQASAMQVTRTDDPEVTDAAREMRSSAQRAIAELRTLMDTLRSGAPEVSLPGTSLDDLAPMLEQLRHDGAHLTSAVFVSDSDQVPTSITRATFRIVQEAVTNALKHAPGQRVDVTVRADPSEGVRIRVVNALTPPTTADGAPPTSGALLGTGSGLLGMHERAEAVGGSLSAHPTGTSFEVTAVLPWAEVPPRPGP